MDETVRAVLLQIGEDPEKMDSEEAAFACQFLMQQKNQSAALAQQHHPGSLTPKPVISPLPPTMSHGHPPPPMMRQQPPPRPPPFNPGPNTNFAATTTVEISSPVQQVF